MKNRLIVLLAFSVALLLIQFSASADEATYTVHFSGYIFPGDHSVDVRYDDTWFTEKATEYHHPLAQLSMGTAMAAFRPKTSAGTEYADSAVHIRGFFETAGFTDIVSSDYEKSPTMYTISSCIARKEITEGGEPFTLIAVAVCGGFYQREWMSNFTVDDGVRHKGFSTAAELVENRVFGYIARRKLNNQRIKIWVVGFSRAGAVANTVGADLYDSEIVAPEDLFVYTFAAPNTTRKVEHDYPNIFNIVGKMDVVPKVPLAGWGYQRYGRDMFTPSRETDTEFETAFRRTDIIFRKLTGESFWTNVGVNTELYLFFEYLLYLIPTPGVYTQHIQSIAVNVIGDKSLKNVFNQALYLLKDSSLINDSNRDEAEELINFILRQAIDLVDDDGEMITSWRSNATMAGNLAHEHCPEMYMSWMLSSDNPEEIFTDSQEYLRFVYQGSGNLAVVDRETNQCVLAVNNDGKDYTEFITEEEKKAFSEYGIEIQKSKHFYSASQSGVLILVIPRDRVYDLYEFSAEEGDSSVYAASLSTASHNQSSIVRLRIYESIGKGINCIFTPEYMADGSIFFEMSDEEVDVYDSLDQYSPTLIDWLQSFSNRNISWREIAFIVILSFTVLYLVIHLVLSAACNRGGKFFVNEEILTRRALVAAFVSGAVLIVSRIISVLFFDGSEFQNRVFWLLGSLIPTVLALIAFLRHKRGDRGLILVGLCICVISDFMVQIDPPAQLAIICIAQGFFAAGFAVDRKPGKLQIFYMILSILLLFGCIWSIRLLLGNLLIRVFGIGILMILLSGLSMKQCFYVRCSALLLFTIDIFEISLMFFPTNLTVELLEYPFYVLALMMISISIMRPASFVIRKKKIPAESVHQAGISE